MRAYALESLTPICPICGAMLVKPSGFWDRPIDQLVHPVEVTCRVECGWSGPALFVRDPTPKEESR